jgi:hypothetical protein
MLAYAAELISYSGDSLFKIEVIAPEPSRVARTGGPSRQPAGDLFLIMSILVSV